MPQYSQHDNLLLYHIEKGNIHIDAENGLVYGKKFDSQGNKISIGSLTKNSYMISIKSNNDSGRTYLFPVCRAIWLNVYGNIPKNMIVTHIDNDIQNNKISNLVLQMYNRRHKYTKTHNTWSDDEIKRLIELYDQYSYTQISKELNRSEHSIRNKCKKLELPPKKKLHFWSKEEDDELKKLYNLRLSIKEIAIKMGRTKVSVRLRANRILNAYRSDRSLKEINTENFYYALKNILVRKTAKCKCCLCDYSEHIDLHHIDGNNKNHSISNIASLCPNHHREVESGSHQDKELFCVWRRIYSDGTCSEEKNNLQEIRHWNGHLK